MSTIPAPWRTDEHRVGVTVSQLLDAIDDGTQQLGAVPVKTGFEILDRVVGGGLFPGDLFVVGGRPSVGKTILTLQMARNLALSGVPVTYVCFEHESIDLLRRLMVLEATSAAAEMPRSMGGSWYRSEAVGGTMRNPSATMSPVLSGGTLNLVQQDPAGGSARARMDMYADRLRLVPARAGAGSMHCVTELAEAMEPGGVLFVDYLQKIETAAHSEFDSAAAALKDLAMSRHLAIVAVIADTNSST
jgi:replicative DNA helicase